ncbi:spore germination protein [Cytobacillus praedii]
MDVDSMIDASVLAEYIEDNPYSPFPQFFLTEHPDFATLSILYGKMYSL